jgi:hypothetical protein
VTDEVRTFLANIWRVIGKPRNLATGVLLSRLLNALTMKSVSRHNITTHCGEFGQYLTWPSIVSNHGVVNRVSLDLGPAAQKYLDNLLAAKQQEFKEKQAHDDPMVALNK